MYASNGYMSARSFNPDTDDEDERELELEEPMREKLLFRLTLKVRKNRMCNNHRRKRKVH